MMGSLLSRLLILTLGYAYPAFECYKAVERNKPDIDLLRFWCQYWIIVALLTVFERFGDVLISWFPMYHEAKVAFLIYLWHSKTRGTTYVYDTFLRPYIGSHEVEIDRNIMELKSRAADALQGSWKTAAASCQSRMLEVAHYVAGQSVALRSRASQAQQQERPYQIPPQHQPEHVYQPQKMASSPSPPQQRPGHPYQPQQTTFSGSIPSQPLVGQQSAEPHSSIAAAGVAELRTPSVSPAREAGQHAGLPPLPPPSPSRQARQGMSPAAAAAALWATKWSEAELSKIPDNDIDATGEGQNRTTRDDAVVMDTMRSPRGRLRKTMSARGAGEVGPII